MSGEFRAIREAQYRVGCFYSNGNTTVAAYAKDLDEARAKRERTYRWLLSYGRWTRLDNPTYRLGRGFESVDVRIVSVATGLPVE
jgi:hypothetical protein